MKMKLELDNMEDTLPRYNRGPDGYMEENEYGEYVAVEDAFTLIDEIKRLRKEISADPNEIQTQKTKGWRPANLYRILIGS